MKNNIEVKWVELWWEIVATTRGESMKLLSRLASGTFDGIPNVDLWLDTMKSYWKRLPYYDWQIFLKFKPTI